MCPYTCNMYASKWTSFSERMTPIVLFINKIICVPEEYCNCHQQTDTSIYVYTSLYGRIGEGIRKTGYNLFWHGGPDIEFLRNNLYISLIIYCLFFFPYYMYWLMFYKFFIILVSHMTIISDALFAQYMDNMHACVVYNINV